MLSIERVHVQIARFSFAAAAALVNCAHAATPTADRVHLHNATTAVIDVLANDEPDSGTEARATFSQLPSPETGLAVEPLEENGLVGVSVSPRSSGDYTFYYELAGNPAATPVRVCWGSAPCKVPLVGNPSPTAICSNGKVCVSLAEATGTIDANALVNIGHGTSGTQRVVAMRLFNGTDGIVAVNLQMGASSRFTRLLDGAGNPVAVLSLTLPPSQSAPFSVRTLFVPSTDANPTIEELSATETSGAAENRIFRLATVGDGTITVPGFESCSFGDTCVFIGGTKLVSFAGGSRIGPYNLCVLGPPYLSCPVLVGLPQTAILMLVRNALVGLDPPATVSFSTDLPLSIRSYGVPVSSVTLESGIPRQIEAYVNPAASDVPTTSTPLVRNLSLQMAGVPSVSLPVNFTVDYQGAHCEACRLLIGGVPHEPGELIRLGSSPVGTVQEVEVEIRNEAQRAASIRVQGTPVQGDALGKIELAVSSEAIPIPAHGSLRFPMRLIFGMGETTSGIQIKDPANVDGVYAQYGLTMTGTGTLPSNPVYGAACPVGQYQYCIFVGKETTQYFGAMRIDGTQIGNAPGPSRIYDFGHALPANEWSEVPIIVVNNFGSANNVLGVASFVGPTRIRTTDGRTTLCEFNPLQSGVSPGSCQLPVPAPQTGNPSSIVYTFNLGYRWLSPGGRKSHNAEMAQFELRPQFSAATGHRLTFVSNCDLAMTNVSANQGCTFVDGMPEVPPETSLSPAIAAQNLTLGTEASLAAPVGSTSEHRIAQAVLPGASGAPFLNVGFAFQSGVLNTQATAPVAGLDFQAGVVSNGTTVVPSQPFGAGAYLFELPFRLSISPFAAPQMFTAAFAKFGQSAAGPPVSFQPSKLLRVTATAANTSASPFAGCAEGTVCLYRAISVDGDAYWDFNAATYVGSVGSMWSASGSAPPTVYTGTVATASSLDKSAGPPWVLANNSSNYVLVRATLDSAGKGLSLGGDVPPGTALDDWQEIADDTYYIPPRQFVPLPLWIRGATRPVLSILTISRLDANGNPIAGSSSTGVVRNTPPVPNPDCSSQCVFFGGVAEQSNGLAVVRVEIGTASSTTLKIANGYGVPRAYDVLLLDAQGYQVSGGDVAFAGTSCEAVGASTSRCRGSLMPGEATTIQFRTATTLSTSSHYSIRTSLGIDQLQFGVDVAVSVQ